MIINDNQRQSMIINDNQWYSRTTNDNQWQQTKHLSLQYFSPFLLSFRSRSIHSNSWKSLKNNHNLLIPMLKLEKLQGSDKPHGWWLGPGATWTSTTLLPACLPPPATRSRSHLLTSSLFQQGKTQHRKGKQELLTLWIEKGRIHGCAPIFLLLSEKKFVRRKKSRIWVPLDFPAVFVFQIIVWVPGPAPGLCQRRHSGKVICHRVTCHFSNLGPGTPKIYQTVCPLLLRNSIFQMTCITSDASRRWLIDWIWFGWISILRKPFF